MSAWRRLLGKRPYALCLAGGLLALMAGDRASLAPPPGTGIDPFEVLDQQVRNNVLIILDTSGSMKWPVDRDNFTLGADDPGSRMYQAKAAIKAVVAANQARVNFGLMSYNILSTGKTLADSQDFANDGRIDGPFLYVSADAAAAPFYTTYSNADDTTTAEADACTNIDGFFCRMSNVFANYDGTNSADVWRSFMNRGGGNNGTNGLNNPYPAGCQVGTGVLSPFDIANPTTMRCRYYMESRVPRVNVLYTWNRASTNIATRLTATATNITCPPPPAGLLGYTSTAPSCFQMQDGAGGPIATYYYTSGIYENQSGNACGGGALITQVAPCTGNNAPLVLANMDPELPVDPTTGRLGSLTWPPPVPATATYLGVQTTPAGLRADQSTPLAGSLNFISNTANTPAFPPQAVASQKNFVILVTDGDDTCADSNVDRAAVLAGVAAQNLRASTVFQHQAETLVVGFASAVNPARVNVIAQGGSGATINPAATNPATAVTGCPSGNCRNAFFASNTQQLIDILNAALEQAAASGVFSGTPSVFDGIPEYVNTIPVPPSPVPTASPYDVMNPETRYRANAFRQYRALFEVNGFKGLVQGYDDFGAMTAGRPSPAPPTAAWEAGQRMIDTDRVSPDLATTDHTFAEMMVLPSTPLPAGSSSNPAVQNNHIHRRIFTTRQNGRRLGRIGADPATDDLAGNTLCSPGPCRVNLWPPDDSVAPGGPAYAPATLTAGILDTRLFMKDDGTQMTLADLQGAPLYACKGTNAPSLCTTGTAAQILAETQKEAREMILAFTAGAAAQRDASGFPIRNGSNLILYRRRPWLLSESTVGTPALVTPPVQAVPTVHTQEYLLYRDGPRDSTGQAAAATPQDFYIQRGFGLRSPDSDGKEVPRGTLTRVGLKPVMSVVYVPANDMLHAFRAGPCPSGAAGAGCATNTPETGAEELWAFAPHDLLPHLKDKMKVQTRTSHTFMISTSLRFADVFVPGPATLTIGGKTYNIQGRWRRLMFFGRGLGGKYYTGLDITGTGSLTNAALDSPLPAVLWNRGNPDSIDGTPAGTPNNTAGDKTLYADMGQTWSIPNVARVEANATNGQREFLVYTGSGYSTGPTNEGTRFYALDPLSGDIAFSDDVGEGLQTAFENALVAGPALFTAANLVGGVDLPHPMSNTASAVFIPDIHGRVWKFNASGAPSPLKTLFRNLGPDQPVAVDATTLSVNGLPYVYVEAGADTRVAAPTGGFAFYGFQDNSGPYSPAVVNVPTTLPDFSQAFGAPPPVGKGDWRGTLQPVATFDSLNTAAARVFFTGTRFNPIAAGACITTFDTIIFGLDGATGNAVFGTQTYTGVKAVGIPGIPSNPDSGGNPPVDQGTGTGGAPPITGGVFGTAAGNVRSGPNVSVTVKTTFIRPGSPVCR